MKKQIQITIILFIASFAANLCEAQLFYGSKAWDTLNQFDSKGRKNGYWVTYLDKNAEPIDSLHSFYFGFELYKNGKPLFTFHKTKWKQKLKLQTDAYVSEPGNPIVLHGIFEWYGSDTLIVNEEEYFYGKPIYFRAYHYSKEGVNCFNEIIYYDIPYQNELGSFYYEESNEYRVILSEYICPGRKRHKKIKLKESIH